MPITRFGYSHTKKSTCKARRKRGASMCFIATSHSAGEFCYPGTWRWWPHNKLLGCSADNRSKPLSNIGLGPIRNVLSLSSEICVCMLPTRSQYEKSQEDVAIQVNTLGCDAALLWIVSLVAGVLFFWRSDVLHVCRYWRDYVGYGILR